MVYIPVSVNSLPPAKRAVFNTFALKNVRNMEMLVSESTFKK